MAFSPDGNYLATAGNYDSVKLLKIQEILKNSFIPLDCSIKITLIES
jgi:hypothetical protein